MKHHHTNINEKHNHTHNSDSHHEHVMEKVNTKEKLHRQNHHINKMEESGHEKMSHGRHAGHSISDFQKRFWISLILTIPILILSPMIQEFLGIGEISFSGSIMLLFILSSIVFFYGGYPFLKGMKDELLYQKQPGMMTLIAIAISTAYIYSSLIVFGLPGMMFFWELATLIDIMLVGHWIEMRSVLGASQALEELVKLLPSETHLFLGENNIKDIPVEELKANDKVLLKPGEKIPADGIIISGNSSVNESMLTGESKPVKKQKDDLVIGGSLNGEGMLVVQITKTGKDTYLAQVIDLVKQAQESRSKTQDLANRAAFYLTIIGIGSGLITMIVWLLLDQVFTFALERTVTVLVIACPHALGLAVPLVVSVSTSLSAKNGFLIRDRVAFEKARDIKAIVFDKTGTLTEGNFGVTEVIALNISENQLIALTAAIEMNSEHPIARGIIEHAKKLQLIIPEVKDFNSIPGKGVEGTVNNKKLKVVSPGYLKENTSTIDDERINKLLEQGKTVVFILDDNNLIGAIALGDSTRKESGEAIQKLKSMGIKTILLTGDNKYVAKAVADELKIDEFIAEVLPHQKSEKIKGIQSRKLITAMVGDGVNDAPALVQADVGIAIGAGTDVAVEAADIILVRNDPRDVAMLIHLARATYKKMLQNLFWATGYNAVAIPLAAGTLYSFGILLNPALGAVLMSLSTVIVAINAKTLKI